MNSPDREDASEHIHIWSGKIDKATHVALYKCTSEDTKFFFVATTNEFSVENHITLSPEFCWQSTADTLRDALFTTISNHVIEATLRLAKDTNATFQ
jgi:hypothetical protein